MKLGKGDPKWHPKTLCFSKFLSLEAPPPPPEKTFWEYKIPPDTIGMYANDTIGDCVLAMIAHHIMRLTAHTGTVVVPDVADIVKAYSALSGYDPSTGANDTGVAITDALSYWQTTGIAGHKIRAWAQIDHGNRVHMNQGVHLFLGVLVGVQLPSSAQTQFAEKQHWEVVSSSNEGGHAIGRSGFGSDGQNYDTWGKGDQKASTAWETKYSDEAYIVLTDDLIDAATSLSPTSLKIDALQEALKELTV